MSEEGKEISYRALKSADVLLLLGVGAQIFDDALIEERVNEFLSDPRHHLVVALAGQKIVGFVSAVDYCHPDKTHGELWINEVAVHPDYQGRGVGQGLLDCTFEHGRGLGCKEAWVLAERSNEPAIKLYAKKGRQSQDDLVMFDFDLSEEPQKDH